MKNIISIPGYDKISPPSLGLIEEAKKHPNGWVYEIDSDIDPNGHVPPEKIKGAWQVDGLGVITGAYFLNPKYKK